MRRKTGAATLNIYSVEEAVAFKECSLLRFDSPDEAWLDFVSDNRAGKFMEKTYDYIFGPVADDNVYTTFMLYTTGVLTKEQTVDALKVRKLYNQLAITSLKGLSFLKFVGTVPKEEY